MLTGVVIARNEEKNLSLCLPGLKFCSEVLVIDNNSADYTRREAQKFKVRVIGSLIENDYAALRNYALEQVKTKWVLFVDADEIVSPQLAEEIISAIQKPGYVGFYLPRTDFLWGKPLNHGDVGSVRLLRLGRRGAGQWQGKVHETWQISGLVGHLDHPLQHHPHPSVKEFISSVNRYSGLRSEELKTLGVKSNIFQILFYPPLKFFYLWIIKKGFLDGTAGFIHAMIMAFYSFLVRSKLYFLNRNISTSAVSE